MPRSPAGRFIRPAPPQRRLGYAKRKFARPRGRSSREPVPVVEIAGMKELAAMNKITERITAKTAAGKLAPALFRLYELRRNRLEEMCEDLCFHAYGKYRRDVNLPGDCVLAQLFKAADVKLNFAATAKKIAGRRCKA